MPSQRQNSVMVMGDRLSVAWVSAPSCMMCGFGGQPVQRERFMTWQTLDRVLAHLPVKPAAVRLNGRGESTIHPDFIPMMERIHAVFPDATLNLFSNLSFGSSRVTHALLEHDVQLFVSLDSTDRSELEAIRRGCRQSVILRNLERLADLRRRPFIVFTMQEGNLHRMAEMASFARERDFHILFNTVRRDQGIEPFVALVTDQAEHLRQTYAAIADLYAGSGLTCLLPDQIHGIPIRRGEVAPTCGTLPSCPALDQELCILFNGDVTPCNMFNPYVLGDFLDTPLTEILSGPNRTWFREYHKTHYYCANCACMGGDGMSCLTLLPYGHTLDYWWETLRGEPDRLRFLVTKVIELHAFRENFRRNRKRHFPAMSGGPFRYWQQANGASPQAKVAVVVPAYIVSPEQASTFAALCRALQAQTRTHFLVIVDDASPMAVSAPEHAIVCRQPVNRGPAAARNRGIALALAEGAEIIALTDADCRPSPDMDRGAGAGIHGVAAGSPALRHHAVVRPQLARPLP